MGHLGCDQSSHHHRPQQSEGVTAIAMSSHRLRCIKLHSPCCDKADMRLLLSRFFLTRPMMWLEIGIIYSNALSRLTYVAQLKRSMVV